MAYADPSSIFDHWKWNETRASQPGVIWVKPTKVLKQEPFPVFLSVQFWKCLLNDVNLVTWNDDGIDQRLA